MKIAVMQPYIFPYIGYFQLIQAVDHFVFYDDVNYIKRGWINRNKILLNKEEKLISFPCLKASQNKKINEIEINLNDISYTNILATIEQAYSKAPYFKDIYPIVQKVLTSDCSNIAELASLSILESCKYLNIEREFHNSSQYSPNTLGLEKADRLIAITNQLGSNYYINALGGKELYSKEYFNSKNVKLSFLNPRISSYKQFENDFVGGLSIIDVMMFNDKVNLSKLIKEFDLI